MVPFKIPGVSVVFSEHGNVVIDEAYGLANIR
mgnify:CR=1 FL=1